MQRIEASESLPNGGRFAAAPSLQVGSDGFWGKFRSKLNVFLKTGGGFFRSPCFVLFLSFQRARRTHGQL